MEEEAGWGKGRIYIKELGFSNGPEFQDWTVWCCRCR